MNLGLLDYARQKLSNENSVLLADNEFKVIFTYFVQKIHEKSENDQFQ